MNIELTPELEIRLQQAATRQGIDAATYALQMLDHTFSNILSCLAQKALMEHRAGNTLPLDVAG